jgi:cytochrome oxidase Cu insertion factor (SCO1/SenC/PrrC family)
MRWAVWGAALVAGIGGGILIARSLSGSKAESEPSTAVETWPAGARRAPSFTLLDQAGRPVTLASLRGRPAIVTFIDPLCRNFCPREASVLSEASARLGANAPAIVSVSVNPWADSARNFREDAAHWRLAPGWRWGTGTFAALAAVWRHYDVGVAVTKKTIAGVTVREITHTGAAYLLDAHGYERALFLYPFTTAQVVNAAKNMLSDAA